MKVKVSVVLLSVLVAVNAIRLEEKFAWKQLQFSWPTPEAEQESIQSGQYIPANNLPLGLEVWKDKLFITIPRWKSGVAASLTYVQIPNSEKSPIVKPYPNWESNLLPPEHNSPQNVETNRGRSDAPDAVISEKPLENNASIISTFRVRADECDRLWVMDTGLADILGSPNQITPPAIVIFDLNTDQLIRRYTFPPSNMKHESFFANIVIDTSKDDCNNAFAYVPDLGGYGVVVYSFAENRSWRVKHNFFHFDPLGGDYNVAGVNFQWTDGVFALAVGSVKVDGTRDVYFHAFSSTKEFAVSNKILQNESYVNTPAAYNDFKLVGDRGPNGQSSAEFYDPETQVIFYTQVNKDAIACWNVNKPYNPDTQGLVDSDSLTLIFPNDLKIDRDGYLWALSDRMPLFIYKSLDPNDYNYRIFNGRTKEIIKGTPCES